MMTEPSRRPSTESDRFGLLTCPPEDDAATCYTHRSILGVSMGAHGAGVLGFSRPELFDTVGLLGVPLVDWVYMLRNMQRSYLGGFCDRETILAGLDAVADPATAPFCGPVAGKVKLTPGGELVEPAQDFNHWYRWVDNGRGGSFGRGTIGRAFQDLALALGNPLIYREGSPYYPLDLPADFRSRSATEKCTTPPTLTGRRNLEWNPEGRYPMIVPCDTGGSRGAFDPEQPARQSMEIGLAVDYNGNGQRDYAEPIVVEMWERFEDIGCSPSDTYDWDQNPSGTRGNWRHEACEPFSDDGLDGVPGTGDYGEGNGRFDLNPNVANYFDENPRRLLEEMPEGQLSRMHIYADAGIRDFLVSAGGTNWLWGSLTERVGAEARDVDTFASIAPSPDRYDVLALDFAAPEIGRHLYVRYGDVAATESAIQAGDGHHVGPPGQVVRRFLTAISFAQSRIFEGDRRRIDDLGDLLDLVEPQTFVPPSLGRERSFGIVLPPGYDDPANAEARYPVMYFLHGQGQESDDLLATALLFFGYMADSNEPERVRRRQSDWAKFILVFPDSTCEEGFCGTGNFNTNHRGIDGQGPAYADSIFELMRHVEQTYRVRAPTLVPK